MIKKSAMAPIWQVRGELSLCVKQAEPGSEAIREGMQPTLTSLHPPLHLTETSVCQEKQMRGNICLRVSKSSIERVLAVEPDESRPVTLCVYTGAYSNYLSPFPTFITLDGLQKQINYYILYPGIVIYPRSCGTREVLY